MGLIRSKAVPPVAENIAFAIPASAVADFVDLVHEYEVPENEMLGNRVRIVRHGEYHTLN